MSRSLQVRARAGRAAIEQIIDWSRQGQSAPARLLDPGLSGAGPLDAGEGFAEWAHYPQPDAIDPESGWRFYYHAHPRSQLLRREHGHFHIFVPGPRAQQDAAHGAFSHLIALSVDERGLPLRLFTTNRWVTNETWQAAPLLMEHVRHPALREAAPRDVARWLNHLLMAFAPMIATLLVARDQRLEQAQRYSRAPFEDRRLRIPSQRTVRIEWLDPLRV
ncbi:hypothetical protein ACOSOMT5_P2336 [Acidiphilium sp. MT5]